jgi:alpha,alpha-trehalase
MRFLVRHPSFPVRAPWIVLALRFLLNTDIAFTQAVHDLPPRHTTVRVAVVPVLNELMSDEDTDRDSNITIDDPRIPGTSRGDKRFRFSAPDGRPFEIAGTYYLSNLLAALKVAHDANTDSVELSYDSLFDPPVDHLSRSIRDRYWNGLTRTLDEQGLRRSLKDEKTRTVDGSNSLYVPHDDSVARDYFQDVARRHPEWKLRVETLPAFVTPEYVRGLDGRHGIVTLGLQRDARGAVTGTPFVVPGGRFNEMYGWDSYFILLGLLHDGFPDLAKSIVDNVVY